MQEEPTGDETVPNPLHVFVGQLPGMLNAQTKDEAYHEIYQILGTMAIYHSLPGWERLASDGHIHQAIARLTPLTEDEVNERYDEIRFDWVTSIEEAKAEEQG